MGGIKNKSLLNKAINKVPLWLKGNVRRQSDKGIVLTKYLGIACLSLAILSTLILNIISSYSSSKVNSNAEPVSNSNANVSALADNEASANALDPTSISISISSYPSATGDTNDPNLSLSIPQGGGLVAGRHTVSINAGNEMANYSVFLNGGTNENGVDNTDLVNTMADSLPSTGSLATSISSLAWSGDFSVIDSFPMQGNAWGVALPDNYPGLYNDKSTYESLITSPDSSSNGPMYTFSGIPPISDGQRVPNQPLMGNEIIRQEDNSLASIDIYYGVKVDDSSTMLAGDYTTNVVYTVIAELKVPSITSISPNPIRTGTSNRITIKGHNLSIVSKVTIDDRGTIRDCTNITHSGTNNDTTLTCTLPAISNTGTYVITAETEGGQTATTQIQLIPPVPSISSVTTDDGGTEIATGDFISNGSIDSGEECTIQYVADNKVTCTAPSRSTAGGPYTVRLTTDGGSVSKASAVSYVAPVPTVTSVSPSPISVGESFQLTISGKNLNLVGRLVSVELPEDYSPRSISFVCSDINDTEISSCESIAIYNVRPSFTGSLPIRIVLHSQDAANSYSFDGFLTLTNS